MPAPYPPHNVALPGTPPSGRLEPFGNPTSIRVHQKGNSAHVTPHHSAQLRIPTSLTGPFPCRMQPRIPVMPRRLDPPGTRSRTMGQENGKKVDRSQKSSATPIRSQQLDRNPGLHPPMPPGAGPVRMDGLPERPSDSFATLRGDPGQRRRERDVRPRPTHRLLPRRLRFGPKGRRRSGLIP